MKTQHYFIDLTQRPPRSFRVRLGNYVVLARMLDKGRATLAGKDGTREDVKTLFEFGELDDYVSFGGKA
jgi:hypothetical protein